MVHLADMHFVSPERYSRDAERLGEDHATFCRRLSRVQAEQALLLATMALRYGLREVLLEHLTPGEVGQYQRQARALQYLRDAGEAEGVGSPGWCLALELGGAGVASLLAPLRVLPLEGDDALHYGRGDRDPAREREMARRALQAANPLAVIVLGGAHDLGEAIDSLSGGEAEYWRLTPPVYTAEVQACYAKIAQRKGGGALRYGWEDRGPAPDGRRHVWVGTDSDKGKRRVQISQPGTSGRAKRLTDPGQRETRRQEARQHVAELLERPGQADSARLRQVAQALANMTVDEVRQLAREHGLVGARRKGDLINRVVEQANADITGRQRWARAARKAGFPPRALFETASGIHRVSREYHGLVGGMLAEARHLYRAHTGRQLTRNHRAFRGGDPAGLEGFDAIARTMADRYPELLGAHGYEGTGDSDEAARRLYDYLLAGSPSPPRWEDSYGEALGYLQGQGEPARRRGGQQQNLWQPEEEGVPFARR